MGGDNELEEIDSFGEDVVLKGISVRDYWVRPPYEVYVGEEIVRTTDDYRSAIALSVLLQEYDDSVLDTDERAIPVEIAVDGRPSIATYLRGVHENSREEVGEVMDVSPDTVRKYISRFRPDRRS